MRVLVEPMWGAGAGWIPRLLAGGKIQVTEIHSERNPWFGGVNPEPIAPNIDESLGILAGGGYDIGLLLDGDADRAGAADEQGTFIHQLEVMGLLMYYLLEHRGLRQPVVSTINETSMVGRLGEKYGVPVYETPVGFKYVGPKMIETGAMMGGEESGGYGFGMHLPERDGIYADLLLLDLFIRERESRPLAGVEGGRPPARDRGSVVLPAHRRARRSRPPTRRSRSGCWSSCGNRRRRRSPDSRSSDRSPSTPTTASSSGAPTGRGCWCASAAPSRWCGSTRRHQTPADAGRAPRRGRARWSRPPGSVQRSAGDRRPRRTERARRPGADRGRSTRPACSALIGQIPAQLRDAWTRSRALGRCRTPHRAA